MELPNFAGADLYIERMRKDLAAAGFHSSMPRPIDPLWPAQDPALLVVDELSALDAFRAMEVARAALGLDQEARYTIHMEGTPSLNAMREYLSARNSACSLTKRCSWEAVTGSSLRSLLFDPLAAELGR